MRYLSLSLMAAAATLAACAGRAPTTSPEVSLGGDPSVQWGPAPAVFRPGAELAVLEGDPSKSGPFTVRLRMPAGYYIAPHTHPTDENVTVIAGAFKVGMGAKFDTTAMKTLPVGGFVTAPQGMAHYAMAVGPTVVQVHGLGPFALTYVNPADTPVAARR